MADDAVIERLVTEWDANTDKILAKINGLNHSVHGTAQSIEQRFSQINLGKALEKGFDESRFNLLNAGAAHLRVFGSALEELGPLGLSAAGGIVAFAGAMKLAEGSADWADKLKVAADKVGETTTTLQQFDYAANATGIPIETMRAGLEGLNEAIGRVQDNLMRGKNNELTRAFSALGISQADLKAYNTAADLLPVIADRIREVHSAAEQSAIAKELGIAELLPLLKQGGDRIRDLTDEAQRLGAVVDGQTVSQMAELSEQMKTADQRFGAAAHTLGSSLIPELVALKDAAADAMNWVAKLFAHPIGSQGDQWAQLMRAGYAAQGRANAERQGFQLFGDGPLLNQFSAKGRAQAAAQADKEAADDFAQAAKIWGQQLKGNQVTPTPKPTGYLPDNPATAGRVRRARAHRIAARLPREQQTAFGKFWDQHSGLSEDDAWNAFQAQIATGGGDFSSSLSEPRLGAGAPQLNDVNGHLLSDNELQSMHDSLAQTFRGAMDAGIRGGWPGLVQYMAQALRDALLNDVANAAASFLLGQKPSLGFSGPLGDLLRLIPGHAQGTGFAYGGLSWVGEKGPELINLPRGSQVFPSNTLSRVGVDRGMAVSSTIVNNSFQLDSPVVTSDLVAEMHRVSNRAAQQYSAASAMWARKMIPAEMAMRSAMALR